MAQSNFDRRRINGPDESFPIVYEDEEDTSPLASWKPGKSRPGRAPSEIRPICEIPDLRFEPSD